MVSVGQVEDWMLGEVVTEETEKEPGRDQDMCDAECGGTILFLLITFGSSSSIATFGTFIRIGVVLITRDKISVVRRGASSDGRILVFFVGTNTASTISHACH